MKNISVFIPIKSVNLPLKNVPSDNKIINPCTVFAKKMLELIFSFRFTFQD